MPDCFACPWCAYVQSLDGPEPVCPTHLVELVRISWERWFYGLALMIRVHRGHGRLDLYIGRWPRYFRLAFARVGLFPNGRRWKIGRWNPHDEPDY